jgi:hypothetical protein
MVLPEHRTGEWHFCRGMLNSETATFRMYDDLSKLCSASVGSCTITGVLLLSTDLGELWAGSGPGFGLNMWQLGHKCIKHAEAHEAFFEKHCRCFDYSGHKLVVNPPRVMSRADCSRACRVVLLPQLALLPSLAAMLILLNIGCTQHAKTVHYLRIRLVSCSGLA